jgi:uncharacterized membrane protein YkvA (DUF1232 family)
MKFSEMLKIKAPILKRELTAVYYAYQNPKVKLLPKIIIAISIGYALSPIDLIPDFIPVIGYLDDLIIIPCLISLAIKLIPRDVMDEARRKAEKEPLRLKKNWVFAIIFILVWVLLLTVIVIAILKLFERK